MHIRKILPYQAIHYWLCILIAFVIPFYNIIVAYVIAILVINWVVGIVSFSHLKRIYKIFYFWNSIIFYFFYFFSDLHSLVPDAKFDLGAKISLLIFPVVFFMSGGLSRNQVMNILKSLTLGCFLACVIALIHAIIIYVWHHQIAFYYAPLATFHHPGYFAMYIDMSVAILIYSLFFTDDELTPGKKAFIIFQLIFFTIFLALLTSKMGIICYSVILIITLFYLFKTKQNIKKGLSITAILALIFILSSKFLVINNFKRFVAAENYIEQHQFDASSVESTSVRVFVWRSACEVIKRNFFTGLGTGNAKDSLMKQYKNDNVTGAFREHLNAHNQFLQTTLALGILGGLLLLFNLIYPSVFAVNNNYLYLIFLIIIFMNCLTESILESQAGVVYYGFFNALFAANVTVFKPENNSETAK
jgi:O-antigen ligase